MSSVNHLKELIANSIFLCFSCSISIISIGSFIASSSLQNYMKGTFQELQKNLSQLKWLNSWVLVERSVLFGSANVGSLELQPKLKIGITGCKPAYKPTGWYFCKVVQESMKHSAFCSAWLAEKTNEPLFVRPCLLDRLSY